VHPRGARPGLAFLIGQVHVQYDLHSQHLQNILHTRRNRLGIHSIFSIKENFVLMPLPPVCLLLFHANSFTWLRVDCEVYGQLSIAKRP
jgi:hypothetical protein